MLYIFERHAAATFEICLIVVSVGYRNCTKVRTSDTNPFGKLKEPVINRNCDVTVEVIEVVVIVEVIWIVVGKDFLQASCNKLMVNKAPVDLDRELFEGGIV